MTRKIQFLVAAAVLLCATAASAARFGPTSERVTKEFRLNPNGTFWIDNPVGNIDVVAGSPAGGVTVSAVKILTGVDEAAIREASDQTQLTVTGSPETLIIRTVLPLIRTNRWASVVHYTVTVPPAAQVKIESQLSERVRVANINGSVTVKNVAGDIVLENISGPVIADSSNGDVIYEPSGDLPKNVQLSSVNGDIRAALPPDSSFQWVGQTIRGDFRTNLPVTGRLEGSTFRGAVNGSSRTTMTTVSLMGNVFLFKKGTTPQDTHSVRTMVATSRETVGTQVIMRSFHEALVPGDLTFTTSLGNVSVGQIRGRARIATRAGEVELGIVLGDCTVTSGGGPLNLGEITGLLNARTDAGDVVVSTARSGGFAATDGGMIRVIHAFGPMTLRSGGGDISITTESPVNAETSSGDITITLSPQVRRSAVYAKTSQGNVVLNVNPMFSADIEATLLTSNENATIRSDFSGLSIRRDQVGKKTRIRATGKVNGGGDKVELFAEDGTIQITGESRPMLVSPVIP